LSCSSPIGVWQKQEEDWGEEARGVVGHDISNAVGGVIWHEWIQAAALSAPMNSSVSEASSGLSPKLHFRKRSFA